MADVFVLGAGFSHAAAPHMPLLAELPELLRSFDPIMWREDKWDDLLDDHAYNFELALSYLAQGQPFLEEPEALRNRARFLQASRVLGAALQTRQDVAVGTDERPEWLGLLVDTWVGDRSVVITLNYDTLIEKVYADPAGHGGNYLDLYPVAVTPAALRRAGVWDAEVRATFSLLKLHGSTNWFYSGSELATGEPIYFLPPSAGWTAESAGFQDVPEIRDRIPFVVPPTAEKSLFFGNESLRAQWRRARLELENAATVFFIGYSLPITDLTVRFMLGRLRKDQRVYVVNRVSRSDPDQTDDECRAALLVSYKSAMPRIECDGGFVRVDAEVMEDFVEAYATGAL
jgi:SIR2-like domain